MEKERHPSYLIFIFALSLLALVALVVQTLFRLDRQTLQILGFADDLVCVVFFIDFCLVLGRSENKLKYFLTWGWLDLLSSIPLLDTLRWGRLARITRIFRVLRGVRSARLLSRMILRRRAESAVLSVVLVSIILLTISAISVLHFENGAEGAVIKTAEDAVWWSVVTITTVGYGDRYPVTTEGRMVATVLMIAGVGLFGTLSGFVASWFMGASRAKEETEIDVIKKDLAEIRRLLENTRRTSAKEGGS
jgi:voltage-gated potassium channel